MTVYFLFLFFVLFIFFAFSRPSPAPAVAGRVRDTVFPAPGSQQRLSNSACCPRAPVRLRRAARRGGAGGRGPGARIFNDTELRERLWAAMGEKRNLTTKLPPCAWIACGLAIIYK